VLEKKVKLNKDSEVVERDGQARQRQREATNNERPRTNFRAKFNK
jgi:hypothetical protein